MSPRINDRMRKKAAVLPLASLVGGNISDDSKTKKVEVHRSNAGCPSGEVKLFDFQPAGATQSCCREVPPKCLREGERWEPINMPGQSRTDTENWQDCQRRCLKVTGCSHFSYWQDGGCHLQDSSATMVVAPAYVTSGPPTCEMQVCAGCAFSSGNSCQRCAGGFIWRDGQCTACTSSGGWLSVDGRSCMQLAASDCSDEKVRGQSSNEACCQCGGGVVTPTPFSYPNSRWSLDSNIVMKPEPRTALRYTVDSKCELAAHNLTMDSSTGEISYMSGRSKPVEAFSFECEITAHQATGVSLASVVTVAADVLSYSSATLLFHGDGQEELPLTTGSGWSKFETWLAARQTAIAAEKNQAFKNQLYSAVELIELVSWLSIVASTGTLRRLVSEFIV
ncbi:unnamed protein product [Symbiodinium natans]|uniref:Apple domain-containing protein n=1 Tax=Symbiodinium natans TaxID=878477 RepID=A0A812KMZ5_9DINO|nr:unnamed protein product [Symbiodinium natans]